MSFIKKTCAHCGKEFEARTKAKKHCSGYCRRQFQNVRRKKERKEVANQSEDIDFCIICGKPFVKTNPQQAYCSNACRKKAANLRHRGVIVIPCEPCIPLLSRWEPEGEEITSNSIPEVWPAVLPCGFLSCSQQEGKVMQCARCPRSLLPAEQTEEEQPRPAKISAAPSAMDGPRLTLREAAALLRIHPRTLSRLLKNGAVYGVHTARKWMIPICVVRSMFPAPNRP